MNKRIGLLFAVVFFILWAMHLASDFLRGIYFSATIEPFHLFLMFSFVLCFISTKTQYAISKVIQISIVCIAGIWTTYSDSRAMFSGLSLFFIAILLAYSYGIYNKHIKLRIVFSIVFLYIVFVLSPSCDNQNRFINAFTWIGFISAMCFAVWFIFKDQIEKLKTDEQESKERYMRIL